MDLITRFLKPVLKIDMSIYHGYVNLVGSLLRYKRREGIEVMERDWDNLIILDACRYDSFKQLNEIEGVLEKVNSQATCTPQWLKRNFTEYYDDVVFVAGNPYVSSIATDGYFDAEEHFFHVDHVWEHGWDDDSGTVTPEKMNQRIRELKEKYPEKRFIMHYLQPHEPFIAGDDFSKGDRWSGRYEKWIDPEIKKPYMNNLEYILEKLEPLVEELEGEIVISADHGEILGGKYGFIDHPKDVFLGEVCEVPWFKVSEQVS